MDKTESVNLLNVPKHRLTQDGELRQAKLRTSHDFLTIYRMIYLEKRITKLFLPQFTLAHN